MRFRLAQLLRRVANRIDPPSPLNMWDYPAIVTSGADAKVTYTCSSSS